MIDAAQALGHIPVDVQALQCDALTAPGRKWLCGPRGTGVLYIRSSFLPQLRPMVVDHRSCPITAQGPNCVPTPWCWSSQSMRWRCVWA